jgi:hydroxycarboxylate dehydrogenase B
MTIEMNIDVPAEGLTDLCADVFERVGSSVEEARRVAVSLVGANLTGHDSHGAIRLPRYVDWVRSGDITPNQTIETIVDLPVLAVVDGRFGFGQTVAPLAVAIGIEKAKAAGLSAVSLRNAGHIGRVGEWAEIAAAAGLISIHFVNVAGSVLVAPFGGIERRLSTAPFCVAVPRQGDEPVVLDFATSLVAEGKVAVASRGGKPLPEGALVGPDGALSSDPATLYGPIALDGPREAKLGKGAIRAFGEHKGSGLALMCELLGGSLTGTGATEPGRRFANGMFSIYVDPQRIDPAHVFDGDAARYLTWFKQAKAMPGQTILTPGEPERAARARRLVEGVPLSRETWDSIAASARSVGLDEARVRRALDRA